MPVNVRYSAALDRTYSDGDLLQSPGTDSGSGASTPASCRTDRTQSSSSASLTNVGDAYGSVDSLDTESVGSHSRQMSSDSTEFIPTRTVKTNAKPAFNPLQFVKTGKSQLVRTAEQQIKQCEEVKKVKERVREDEEAWQSNLDNWKSKRRQISHKTIQKAEEMKQIEEIEQDRQRKKSKTFNEMMEERSKRGTSSTLPVYNEWGHEITDNNDERATSDDNAAAKGDVSFESSGSEHVFHEDDHSNKFTSSTPILKATNGNSEHKLDISQKDRNGNSFSASHKPTNGHSSDRSGTSDEPEYTFDKAIQSYAQFAESRLRHPPSDDGHKGDRFVRSPSSMDYSTRTNSWNDAGSRESSPKKTEAEDGNQIEKMERASGQRLAIVVCLRRGGDNKEFGFSIKSVRGIGSGIFVENVHPQSPAESAGLKVNDEILAINGEFCTSKRTHSAIVFAVKQAVYTGNLELEIYRYDNTDQIQRSKAAAAAASSSPAKAREASPTKNPASLDRSSSETGLQHPIKVDLVKRRSVFEMSPRSSPEKVQNRRSLDVSVKIKDKLASFENGDTPDRDAASGFRKSPKRVSAFQEKLASFRSLDSLNRSSPSRDSRKEPVDTSVLSELMDEDSGEFGHRNMQSFERTRSCEFLDYDEEESKDTSEESRPTASTSESRYFVAGSSNQRFETDLMELQMLVSLADKEEAAAGGRQLLEFEDAEAGRHVYESKQLEESIWMEHMEPVPVGAASRDTSFIPKSGFELAESLEETPITGSRPSSPCEVNASQEFGLEFHQGPVADVEIAPNTMDAADLNLQMENLDLNGEVFVVDHVDPPAKSLEPPKEKPPPPPVDSLENGKKNLPDKLGRVDSTKRIRTEIWKRRTDFLGIDGEDVQKLMQHEVESITPPPTLENLLREDVFGQQWKDGGVNFEEQEAGQDDHAPLEVEKEIARKEREIIENLEWAEQLMQNQEGSASKAEFSSDAGHQVQEEVVTEVVFDKKIAQKDFAQPLTKDDEQPPFYPDSDLTLKMREEELQRQEELLRLEKEKLRQEQEELLRQKEAYQKRIEDHQRGSIGTVTSSPPSTMQMTASPKKEVRPPASPIYETIPPPALVSSEGRPARSMVQPPPTPTKPKVTGHEFNDKHLPASSSPDPPNGADQWPVHQRVADDHHGMSEQQPALQPLTKQALYALSASPKVKLMEGDQWMARRKSNGPRRENYNQHWLVQEAEFRRLHPQQQKQQQEDNERQAMHGDPKWQQGNWNSPLPVNGNYSPSNGNGIYSTSDLVGGSPNSQVQGPAQRLAMPPHRAHPSAAAAEATYAVPQHLHRPQQQQHHFSPLQDRRQDIAAEAPVATKAPPPPHPPKPSSQSPKSKLAASPDRDTSSSQMLSVSGKKKCSHCAEELGRGAAMIIESLQLFYHINCFKCCVCHIQLGNGTSGADVRVRSQKLHCHNCYSNDEGLKFSKV